MGIIYFFCIYKTHISYTFCRQPICGPYHGYNYSYLMLTNFIGGSYMSDFFAKMLTYIELSIGSVVGVVWYCCLECISAACGVAVVVVVDTQYFKILL